MRMLPRRAPAFWKNMRLLQKLLLIFCLLTLLPVLLIFGVFYSKASSVLEGQILYSAQQSAEQARIFLNYKLYNIYQSSSTFVSDASLNEILQRSRQPSYPFLSQVEDMYRLNELAESREDGENVRAIELYVPDSLFYAQGNNRLFGMAQAEGQSWYSELEGQNIVWAAGEESFFLIRKILNSNHYSETLAIARFCFSRGDIEEILGNAVALPEGSAYLINSRGEIICSSAGQSAASSPISQEETETILAGAGEWSLRQVGGSDVFLSCQALEYPDWSLLFLIPRESVLNERTQLLNSLIPITVAFALLACVIAYRLFDSITSRLSGLSVKMREVQTGALVPIQEEQAKDEIGSLIQDYNYMISRIEVLIQEKTKMVGELKNAELKALQAQINPHFLYNTLDMINWMVWSDSKQDILKTVDSLANFYKISLSKGRERISIREELQHVSYYHAIQNMRFDHKIQLIVDVSPEIQKMEILKITLQPIVENSILHGIMEKPEKQGVIWITGRCSENAVSLLVEDDGVGMPLGLIEELEQSDFPENSSHGYGLRNINRRLKLCYGEEFGLFFPVRSSPGAAVEVRLPRTTL